jgi:hypothetical protein
VSAPHVATVDIAGLACRLVCDYAKPALWARELHPGFLTDRVPDLTVEVAYDDGYWERGLPWIAPDTVPDEPVVTIEDGCRVITSSYYRLALVAGERVEARVAGGFGVGGPMRALYGLLLPERERLPLAAAIQEDEDGVVLVCGGDAASAGVVAVVATGFGAVAYPTPFHAGETPQRQPPRPVSGIVLAGQADHRAALTRAEAAALLHRHVVTIDRSPGALLRSIDLAAALAGTVPIGGPRTIAAVAGAGDRG